MVTIYRYFLLHVVPFPRICTICIKNKYIEYAETSLKLYNTYTTTSLTNYNVGIKKLNLPIVCRSFPWVAVSSISFSFMLLHLFNPFFLWNSIFIFQCFPRSKKFISFCNYFSLQFFIIFWRDIVCFTRLSRGASRVFTCLSFTTSEII